jgi:putative serine protease PepD
MADNKDHYNNQFLGTKIQLPVAQTAEVKKAKRGFQASMFFGPLLGVVVGSLLVTGNIPFLDAGTSQVIVNNSSSVNWVTGAAAKALPSVVTLSVSGTSDAGTGSGVVLTKDGYILTNAHVVTLDGATSDVVIEIKTSANQIFRGTVVGTDPTNDLAVVKANGTGFTPIEFTDSSKLNVGDYAVAIGSPLGYDATVTSGVISAMHRTIQVASAAVPKDGGGSLQLWNNDSTVAPVNLDVLQTDAAINPGNSGGALVNEKGQLIGINVAIATANSTSSQAGNIGVGFAIPSNTAKRISDEIIKNGSVSHGLLGAFVSDATNSDAAASFSIGAKVEKLTPGGAAEKAGLKIGDIVIGFDGERIDSASKLTAAVRSRAAFSKVTLTVTRNGKEITIKATLGDADAAN